jgi:hydroxyacylglutathione hydrolase
MFFKQIVDSGLAQNSYLVGCQKTGEAIVIDPRRDVEVFITEAEQNGLTITHIAETHIHADFLAGSRELAAKTGATIYLSDEGGADWQYQYNHVGLRDGDSIAVGNLRLDVLHTPGHTPEHISFLLHDLPAGPDPVMFFSGDFVFVGDVGRPDLLEEAAGIAGTKEAGARQMFHSLRKFRDLPEYVQVWPAHGAGSACGKALGAVPGTTVGYEVRLGWAFQIDDEDAFVAELLAGQPEPPRYFAMMKRLNKEGPVVLGELPRPEPLSIPSFEALRDAGAQIVDARGRHAFAGGHVPGSLCIPNDSSFSTWAGWLLDYEKPIVLVAEKPETPVLVEKLIRIGLDDVAGYIPSVDEWGDSGHPVSTVEQRAVDELSGSETILDVRGHTEHEDGHIPGALNIHAGHLTRRLDEIPADGTVVVHCETGYRSMIASSVLLRAGRTNVRNLIGGYAAWKQAQPSPAHPGTANST